MKTSSVPQFTPEQKVLLWAIRVDHTKDQRIAEILEKGIDWTYIRQTAMEHGIIPLLYLRLTKEMATLVPSDEIRLLRTLFMENAANNLRVTQELFKVINLLTDAGIDAMPFKGPALAVQAYGDLSMRSFCDLDILIHEKDFDRVYKILINRDFTPRIMIDSEIIKKFVHLQKDFSFSGHSVHLEIHWKITEYFLTIPLDLQKIWNQNTKTSLNMGDIKTFSPEDTLILLCVHGSLHTWQGLKWVSDLTYLIKNYPNFEWHEIIRHAEDIGIKRIVTIGLFLAQEYGGISFPSEIKKLFISDIIYYNLLNKITQNFFTEEKILLTPPFYYLKSRERMRDQLNYGIRLLSYEILVPNFYDFNFITLPAYLFPFYFIIRPFRLLKEHIPTLMRFSVR